MWKLGCCNTAVATAATRADGENEAKVALLEVNAGLATSPDVSTFPQPRLPSGVAAAVLCRRFGGGGGAGCVQVVLEQVQHPPLVGLDGEKVDDRVQAAVEVHQGHGDLRKDGGGHVRRRQV